MQDESNNDNGGVLLADPFIAGLPEAPSIPLLKICIVGGRYDLKGKKIYFLRKNLSRNKRLGVFFSRTIRFNH